MIGGDLLTTLLAEGRRSRLVARLREELRLVESIDLDLNVLEAGSLALLEAVCESEQVEAVELEIHKAWRELMEQPLSPPNSCAPSDWWPTATASPWNRAARWRG
ncbi:insulinase family protein [Cyanobium sp. ATX-6F1]|uniref:insulinase family protein n=1 Tax=Cyanobium sp. ATX-6F1 TaxID=3137388 RepID=UPI0039BE82F3